MSTAHAHLPGAHHAAAGAQVSRAQLVRAQVEATLSNRFAGALSPTPRPVRETMPAGVPALDELLGGGLPLGAITELVGSRSSGRTGVAVRTVAAAMREGYLCAWVDASDAFDPESAAANGVCLEQLLWVRCGVDAPAGEPVAAEPVAGEQTATQTRLTGSHGKSYGAARAGQHPRDEVRGLDLAVGDLLRQPAGHGRNRSIGTPGAPNRPLAITAAPHENRPGGAGMRSFAPVVREEQVSSDRQPRRGRSSDTVSVPAEPESPRQAPSQASRQAPREASGASVPAGSRLRPQGASRWSRLDQALRAADLLLQAGGFRVLVLDLGSLAPEQALKIPLATWFRFRAAADQARTVLLALTQVSCAKSSAGLVVHMSPLIAGAGCGTVLENLRSEAEPLRQRFTAQGVVAFALPQAAGGRKAPQATWEASSYPCSPANTYDRRAQAGTA